MDFKQLSVCTDCLRALTTRRGAIRLARTAPTVRSRDFATTTSFRKQVRQAPAAPQYVGRPSTTYSEADREPRQRTSRPEAVSHPPSIPQEELDAYTVRVKELAESVAEQTPASEQRVLYVLEQLDGIAARLMDPKLPAFSSEESSKRAGSATSALLGSVAARKAGVATRASLIKQIKEKSGSVVLAMGDEITPAVLEADVQLQSTLQQPEILPQILTAYTAGMTGSKKSPRAVSYTAASTALAAAMKARNLALALEIIDCTFATPAYTRNKIIRQAGIPGAAFAAFPLVAYGASLQFSAWQTMLDPNQATTMAFAGFMTYAAAVGSVGYVAITTANDQMDRVTWVAGTPLWERWIREDERAALDKVAAAWGFKSIEKRGDEEGEDWEQLREQCGIRGMVLDKVELMEGME